MTSTVANPLILTPGEPGGVGIDITLKAWLALRGQTRMAFALLGDAGHIADVARSLGMPVPVAEIPSLDRVAEVFVQSLPVMHHALPAPVSAGGFSAATAPWVMEMIDCRAA